MTKRNYIVLGVIGGVIVLVIILLSVFGKRMFGHNKDKALTLLQASQKISLNGSNEAINNRGLIEQYYRLYDYTAQWSGSETQNSKRRASLFALLDQANLLGLCGSDFHRTYLSHYDSLAHLKDFDATAFETENELVFNDAALSFFFETAYGQPIGHLSFEGVKYKIDTLRVLNLFHEFISQQAPQRTLDSLEPQNANYKKLKSELNRFNAVNYSLAFSNTVVIKDNAAGNVAAIQQLIAYNLLSKPNHGEMIAIDEYKAALISFQKMVDVDTTGKLDVSTRAALSVPLSKRVEEIKKSLNFWRWTNRLEDKEFIFVNTASARLQIISPDSLVNLNMKVIVGKHDTRTPSFTAYITQVITYPYWTVPRGIAVKEMLPKILKKRSYLDENNLQVINTRWETVDPSTIAWFKLSKNNFPYTIRQSTGCDNSLGLMKFDLNSPFSIYLHDTDAPGLFGKKERHLSHGCVRLEKPKELARFILDRGPDTLLIPRIDSCMKDQKPNEFKLKKRVPVLLLYMIADIDETGHLKFYKDVYSVEAEEQK